MSSHRRVHLDELAELIASTVDQIGPVVVQGSVRDWHVSNTIGRGQLITSDTRLQVVVMAWKQRHRISEGNRVKVVGQVQWSPRFGLQIVAQTSIEPIGLDDADQARRQLLQQLTDATTAQHELSMPADIKTVLVVGPKNGSAAVRDAKSVLSPLGLRVLVTRIAMSGPKVTADLMLAMTKHPDVDVVLVIRGGGAASDLSAFDSPKLVEAAANHRVPIIAGIGHATNTTAFDLAVWKSTPTPSQAAQAIVDIAGPARPAISTPATCRPAGLRPRPARPSGPQPVPTQPPTNIPQKLEIRWRVMAAALVIALVLIAINVAF